MLFEHLLKQFLKSARITSSKFHLLVSFAGPLVFFFGYLIIRLGPLGNGQPLTCLPKTGTSLTIDVVNGLAYSANQWVYSTEETESKLFDVDEKLNFGYLRYLLISTHTLKIQGLFF